jgi:N utilization substance protein A
MVRGPAIFAANALSPAKVNKVTVTDFENKKLQVTVENEQQSLAIGKRGQNVRLAAKLVGWDIDIRSEEEMRREVATQMEQLISAPVALSLIEGLRHRIYRRSPSMASRPSNSWRLLPVDDVSGMARLKH